jgi:hypothetical protein
MFSGAITMYAIAYKKGSRIGSKAVCRVLSLAVLATVYPVMGAKAQKGETGVSCTNLYSGATWQMRIDYDRSTVDSNPARINEATISWRDAKDGRSYILDRKSGKLTVILASATGGNFLYDQCKLEN